jgi:hypothetical protein
MTNDYSKITEESLKALTETEFQALTDELQELTKTELEELAKEVGDKVNQYHNQNREGDGGQSAEQAANTVEGTEGLQLFFEKITDEMLER